MGAALTGTGVTQNAGTTVNAKGGTALIDGNDGTILLAGNLTSTNTGATAVVIRDASSAQLNTIQAAGYAGAGAGDEATICRMP